MRLLSFSSVVGIALVAGLVSPIAATVAKPAAPGHKTRKTPSPAKRQGDAKSNYTLEEALTRRARLFAAPPSVSWVDSNVYAVGAGNERKLYDARSGNEIKGDAAAPALPPTLPAGGRRRPGASGGVRLPRIGESASPDGRFTVRIKDNDLYVTEKGGAEKQITRDGSPTILNGVLDWVYDEEIYGRGSRWSYVWSPDSKKVAFLRLDEAKVPSFPIVNHLPQPQNVEQWQYPTAGQPNPDVELCVVDVTEAVPDVKRVDLSAWAPDDRLVARFGFTPDSNRLLAQVQNRIQSTLTVLSIDPANGKNPKRIIEEKSDAWVDVTDFPTWLPDNTFLWQSERTGFAHLYRYKADGTLLNAVTKGPWDVKRVIRIDDARGTIFFDGNGKNVTDAHLWRARLDGVGDAVCLTNGDGAHSATFNTDQTLFLDTVSSAEMAGEVRLCDARDGKVLRVVAKADAPPDAATRRLGKPRFVTFPARDGYKLEGTLLLPPDWDPKKRYPVFCPVYAGPSSPTARNAYSAVSGSVDEQFYAQRGIIVWKMDNRSANPRGSAAKTSIYKNMGASELRDIEDGLKFLISRGYADPEKIGISGWSYGGFMSAYALTHSTMFRAGLAGAGPVDWSLYDTIYTERYMSTPTLNPDGYRSSSVIDAAGKLTGNLLIQHGAMDDNVHVQNTFRLIEALQKADKDFTLMVYPGASSRHGIGNPQQSRHQRRTQMEFVLKHLGGGG